MQAQKVDIINSTGLKLQVLVEAPSSRKNANVIFIAHGLGGHKEEPQIQALAEYFKKNNYTVVRWDMTNSVGESEGAFENATVTNYYADLESVIAWAQNQAWYKEPFILSGHSLGGMCSILYAEKHPEKIKGLIPLSTVISGELSLEAYGDEAIQHWREAGFRIVENSKTGEEMRLPWSHMEDRLQYTVLDHIDALTMPVLLIVGEQDEKTPPAHEEILLQHIPTSKKELHIISGAEHSFATPSELSHIRSIVKNWDQKFFPHETQRGEMKRRK